MELILKLPLLQQNWQCYGKKSQSIHGPNYTLIMYELHNWSSISPRNRFTSRKCSKNFLIATVATKMAIQVSKPNQSVATQNTLLCTGSHKMTSLQNIFISGFPQNLRHKIQGVLKVLSRKFYQ